MIKCRKCGRILCKPTDLLLETCRLKRFEQNTPYGVGTSTGSSASSACGGSGSAMSAIGGDGRDEAYERATDDDNVSACASPLYVTDEAGNDSCTATEDSMWYVNEDTFPQWISSAIEKACFTKGKLACPKCKGRVGAFDFTSLKRCFCGQHVMPAVHLTKSRVDAVIRNLVTAVSRVKPRLMSAAADLRSEISQLQMNIESSMGVNTYNATSEESVVDGTTESGAGMVMCQSSSGTSSSEATNTVTSASGSQVDSVDSSDLVEPGSLGLHNHTTASEDISSTDHADNGFSSNRYTLLETEDDLEEKETCDCAEVDTEEPPVDSSEMESLMCSVCLELFYLPHECLPCRHVFCSPCLRRLRESAGLGVTKCPLCREVIRKCIPNQDLQNEVKSKFPAEFKTRQNVEKKFKKKLAPLPGVPMSALQYFQIQQRQRPNNRDLNPTNFLTTCSGVCCVVLLMMLAFTVFATTVGFVLWYVMEVAMEVVAELAFEANQLCNLAWQALIILCIDGKVPHELKQIMSESCGKILGAFTRLVNRTQTFLGEGEVPPPAMVYYVPYDVTNGTSPFLSKVAQANIANYLLLGGFFTYCLYRLAKYIQGNQRQ